MACMQTEFLMTAYLFLIHGLNLLAPAAALALLMAILAPRLPGWSGNKPAMGWPARFVWGLLVNVMVVMAGLYLAAPGKVLIYAALVVASALTQFVLLGGWRR